MLQFCGWAAVFRNMADMNVRYELACKLYYEFLLAGRQNLEIPMPARVRESLVGVLAPLLDADDFESVCELPMDFFDEAVQAILAQVRESMYASCMQEMRERWVALSHQAARDEEATAELRALQLAVQLTFDEFVIVMKSYRDLRHASSVQQHQHQQLQMQSGLRRLPSSPPMASVLSGSREFRALGAKAGGSGARNSPQVRMSIL